jgi:hypothetical protein
MRANRDNPVHRPSVATLIIAASFASQPASAERCPTSADMPKGITLHQRNSTIRIRATGEHEIRTETTTKGVGTFVDTTYDGLVPISSGPTTPNGNTTRRFVYPTDYRAFRPELGQSFAFNTVYRTGDWFFGVESTDTNTLNVVGRDTVRIGDCAYPTVVVEEAVAEGMRGIMSDQVPPHKYYRLQYSPDLRAVLYGFDAFEPAPSDTITAD